MSSHVSSSAVTASGSSGDLAGAGGGACAPAPLPDADPSAAGGGSRLLESLDSPTRMVQILYVDTTSAGARSHSLIPI